MNEVDLKIIDNACSELQRFLTACPAEIRETVCRGLQEMLVERSIALHIVMKHGRPSASFEVFS